MVNFCGRIRKKQFDDRMAQQKNTDAHQNVERFSLDQRSAYAEADTVLLTGTEVLRNVVGDRRHHGIIHKDGELVGFGSCRVAGNRSRSKRVDNSLHRELADTHDGHLKAHRKAGFQVKNSSSFQVVEILTAQVQNREIPKSDNRAENGGEELRENRRPGSARNAHVHRNDEHDVEDDVEHRREHQKIQRCFAVAECAEHIGNHVVEHGSAGAEQNNEHIGIRFLCDVIRNLHPDENLAGEQTTDERQHNGERDTQQRGNCDAFAHAGKKAAFCHEKYVTSV